MKLKRWMLGLCITGVAASTSLVACTQRATAAAGSAAIATAATVPPPRGDRTPTPVDRDRREAADEDGKTGASERQSTVGTPAAGAPA